MKRKTQLERIKEILEREGSISRNMCLTMYITRLASRIDDLEHKGSEFKTTRSENGDYLYQVVAKPAPEQLSFHV